ncbi:MAG: DUF3800 domain-containing protein [Nitrospirota bacterium]
MSAPVKNNRFHLEHLWWVMHHSDDPDRMSIAVTCYLDESTVTLGNDSPYAVVAGVLFRKPEFLYFEEQWQSLLSRYGITPPLHMRDKPRNKSKRFKFFSECVKLINDCKIYSVAATLHKQQYEDSFAPEIRENSSIYITCFVLLSYLNHSQAEYRAQFGDIAGNIAYFYDHGCRHKEDLRQAYDVMMEWQKLKPLHVGSFTEDSRILSTFQAADLVAWAVHRKINNHPFHKGLEPIEELLNEEHHIQHGYDGDFLQRFADAMNQLTTWRKSLS